MASKQRKALLWMRVHDDGRENGGYAHTIFRLWFITSWGCYSPSRDINEAIAGAVDNVDGYDTDKRAREQLAHYSALRKMGATKVFSLSSPDASFNLDWQHFRPKFGPPKDGQTQEYCEMKIRDIGNDTPRRIDASIKLWRKLWRKVQKLNSEARDVGLGNVRPEQVSEALEAMGAIEVELRRTTDHRSDWVSAKEMKEAREAREARTARQLRAVAS